MRTKKYCFSNLLIFTTAGGGGGIGNGANGNNQTSNSTRNRAMDESVDHLFKEGKKTLYIITNSCSTREIFEYLIIQVREFLRIKPD